MKSKYTILKMKHQTLVYYYREAMPFSVDTTCEEGGAQDGIVAVLI